MKTDTISAGQAVSLLLVSRLATVATFSPAPANQTEVWSTVAYGITWCLLLIPGYLLARVCETDLLRWTCRRHPLLGKTVSMLFGAFCLYVVSINASQFIYFVREALSPDMAATALCIALITAAFWAALYGVEALARAAVPIAALMVVGVVAVSVLLAGDMRFGYVAQTLTAKWEQQGWWYDTVRSTESVVAGFLLAHVKRPRVVSSVVTPTLAVTGGTLLIRLTVIGALGEFSLRCFYPYHVAVTAIGAGGVSRLDAVFVSVWIAALFVKTALFAWAFIQSTETLFSPSCRRAVIPACGLLTAVVGIVLSGQPHTAHGGWIAIVSAVGIGLFAAVLPLSVWLVIRRRKRV